MIAKGNAFLNEGKGSGPHKGKGPKPKKDWNGVSDSRYTICNQHPVLMGL
jgi:hypothetical protein